MPTRGDGTIDAPRIPLGNTEVKYSSTVLVQVLLHCSAVPRLP